MATTGGDSNKTVTERLQASSNRQPMVARCVLCPDWQQAGTAAEARAAQLEHRHEFHPETFRARAHRPKRFAWRNLSREQEEQIEEERRERLRSLGMI
jgi:hypothetical protein